MAPTVKLLLDDRSRSYSCGKEISGRVEINAVERVAKAELTISLAWKGSGEAPNSTVSIVQDWETKILSSGDCEPGASVHPFKLQAPVLARTYHGRIINVDWALRAEMRAAGKTIGSDETAVHVAPPDYAEQTRPETEPVILRDAYKGMTSCLLLSLAFLIGGIAIAWALADFDAEILGVVPGGIGLVGAVLVVRGLLVKNKLSNVEAWVGSKEVRAGSELPVSLKFQTRKPVAIQRISVVLKAWEQVSSTDLRTRGTSRVKKHTLFEQESVLSAGYPRVQPGFPLTFAGNINVPADVPGSLELRSVMRIVWELEFRIVIPKSPDWWDTCPIIVLPAMRSDSH